MTARSSEEEPFLTLVVVCATLVIVTLGPCAIGGHFWCRHEEAKQRNQFDATRRTGKKGAGR